MTVTPPMHLMREHREHGKRAVHELAATIGEIGVMATHADMRGKGVGSGLSGLLAEAEH